jgi:putative MFS transporter
MVRIEEALDAGEETPLQRRIIWIARLSWSFVAMEIIIISFTLPLFARIFSLSEIQQGVLASAVLIGDIIGAVVLGRLSDIVGRRPVFQLSLLWYSVFTALTALSRGFYDLVLYRILAGIGLGGMLVVDPALLSEFLPPRKRGRLMVSLDLFWPFGSLLALALAYVFLVLGSGNWRALFLAAAFPAFIVGFFRLYVPESPFYLAKKGDLEGAARVLRLVRGKPINANSIELATQEQGSYRELFTAYARRTAAVLAAWLALNYTYYGLFLWLPQVLNIVSAYGSMWLYLALAFVLQVPGYISAMFLVEEWGRKKTLVVYLVASGVFGLLMALTTGNTLLFTLALLIVSFFNLGAWGAVYPFTSELFPTKLRGKAFGLAEGTGKVVAVLGPLLFGALLEATKSIVVPLAVTTLVAVVGGILVMLLAPETKGLIFD